MREIKFRAFYDDRMWECRSIMINTRGRIVGFWSGNTSIEGQNVKYMQFTGLKDKNGVEIYESDIVQWPGDEGVSYDYEVEWVDGGWFADGQWLSDINEVVTVVGNKYESR